MWFQKQSMIMLYINWTPN